MRSCPAASARPRRRASISIDLLRRRALLRAEDRRGAVGPNSGLVTSHATVIFTPIDRAAAAVLDQHDRRQVAAAQRLGGGDRLAVFEDDGQPARLRAADAGVDRGAAADAEDDVRDAEPGGGDEQFAGAERGGVRAGCGHPVVRSARPLAAAISTTAVLPSPRMPKVASTFISGSGPVTRRVSNRPPGGRDECRDGAFAAVGHRAKVELRIGVNGADARGDRIADLRRGEAALELVGGDDDAHRSVFERTLRSL